MRQEDLSFFEEDEFKDALEAYEGMKRGNGLAYLDADELTDIAEYYMVHDRSHDAMECIKYALRLHPGSVDPQVFLSRQQMFEGNQKEAWRICNQIEPQDDREVQLLKAELWVRDKQTRIAFDFLIDIYNHLETGKQDFLRDSVEIFLDYAVFDIPMPFIDMMIDANPYDVYAWLLMAEAQNGLGHYEDAIEATDYVLAIREKEPRALLMRANALFQTDKAEEAQELYDEYIHLCPEDDAAKFLNAVCLMALEKYQPAQSILEYLANTNDTTIKRQSIPYRCVCYLNLEEWDKYLRYLPVALSSERDLTAFLLESYYPGLKPEEYFDYTYNKLEDPFGVKSDKSPRGII